MLSVAELQTFIANYCQQYMAQYPVTKRAQQIVPLAQSLNHVLAAPIAAPFDVPRQNLSSMDGFAIATGSDVSAAPLSVVGESSAGKPFIGQLQAGQGVRIFTGAVVPSDCDRVVMQENTNFANLTPEQKHLPYQVVVDTPPTVGTHIRAQGAEVQAGEQVLAVGKRINTSDISLLATLGIHEVPTLVPLTIGILATGDELVAVGASLTHAAQLYDSNSPTLHALLSDLPVVIKDYGILADDPAVIRATLEQAIAECDVIVSSAGVSVGDYDYLSQLVRKLGQVHQHKVAMKPGKPLMFGEFSRGQATVPYFGLPGNPLSVVVGCLNFVKPALWRLAGVAEADLPIVLRVPAVLTHAVSKAVGRQDYQRAHFEQAADGQCHVTPMAAQDSHRVKQLTLANCLLVLPADSAGAAMGETVWIVPLPWALH